MQGTTTTGFVYSVDDDLKDDYEFIEKVDELRENPTSLVGFIKYILGEAQTDALKEHCRGENGKVSASRMNEELHDILNNDGLKK